MDHPKYVRPKSQKVNAVVEAAIKKAKEVKEEKVFEKPVSKFNKCVDLPSLGVCLEAGRPMSPTRPQLGTALALWHVCFFSGLVLSRTRICHS